MNIVEKIEKKFEEFWKTMPELPEHYSQVQRETIKTMCLTSFVDGTRIDTYKLDKE